MLRECITQHPPQDPQVSLAWEYILSAIADGYITEDMAIQSIKGMRGNEMCWDEFGIRTSEEHRNTLEVYYAKYSTSIFCDTDAFIASCPMLSESQASQIQAYSFALSTSLDDILTQSQRVLPLYTWAIHESDYEGRYIVGRSGEAKLKFLQTDQDRMELECFGEGANTDGASLLGALGAKEIQEVQ